MNPGNILLFAGATVSCAFFTRLLIRWAVKIGLVDHPGHRKIHETAVPKTGGVAILASLLLVAVAAMVLDRDNLGLEREVKIALILACTLLTGLLGFLDDLYDFKPRRKLLAQVLLFGTFTVLGSHFQVLHIPGIPILNLGLFGYPLTLVWVLAVVNGFNFMDGLDGLAGSVTAVILVGIGAASWAVHGPDFLGILWASTLGALSVFLFFNWGPAKVYLGDTGSNALGVLTAFSLVSIGQVQPDVLAWWTHSPAGAAAEPVRFQFFAVSLLAGYPLLEVTLSTLRRFFKRMVLGRSLESSEQEHIHHQFLKLGLGAHAICGWVMVFQVLLTLSGLLVLEKQNALATWILAPLFMGLAYMGPRTGFLDFLKLRQLRAKPHYLIANYFICIQRTKMELARNREEILALVSQTCREFGIRCYRFQVRPDQEGKGGIDYFFQNEDISRVRMTPRVQTRMEQVKEGEFYDFCEMPRKNCEAFWIFDSNHRGDELDVEYRVLLSGFMREALEACVKIGGGKENLTMDTVARLPHAKTSGHHLRKRHRRLYPFPDKASFN